MGQSYGQEDIQLRDPRKSRLETVLNILLLVCLIVVLVGGVMKSKVLFPSIAEQFRDGNILGIHVGVS